jgi:hypothetical protein
MHHYDTCIRTAPVLHVLDAPITAAVRADNWPQGRGHVPTAGLRGHVLARSRPCVFTSFRGHVVTRTCAPQCAVTYLGGHVLARSRPCAVTSLRGHVLARSRPCAVTSLRGHVRPIAGRPRPANTAASLSRACRRDRPPSRRATLPQSQRQPPAGPALQPIDSSRSMQPTY